MQLPLSVKLVLIDGNRWTRLDCTLPSPNERYPTATTYFNRPKSPLVGLPIEILRATWSIVALETPHGDSIRYVECRSVMRGTMVPRPQQTRCG
jgi:hypothetical protein